MIWNLMLLAFVLSACAGGYNVSHTINLSTTVLEEMNALYSPWSEKAFCVSHHGVSNIIQGGWMSVDMPLCEQASIPFHTHPVWAEKEANFLDGIMFDEYRSRYGNKRFGVMFGRHDFKVYEKP